MEFETVDVLIRGGRDYFAGGGTEACEFEANNWAGEANQIERGVVYGGI